MELMVVIIIIAILLGIIFTGAGFLFSAQEEKKAKSEIESISLALAQFKSEHGDYPITDDASSAELRGKILFMSLSGWLDSDGDEIPKDERGKSFLPSDSFTLGLRDGESVEPYSLTGEQLLGNIGKEVEVFMIDPWSNAYIYEYPRMDGHSGYLLFSKGEDGQSSEFSTELTSTPNKESFDNDNIPETEPGKW